MDEDRKGCTYNCRYCIYRNINPRFALIHVIVLMLEGIKVEMNIE